MARQYSNTSVTTSLVNPISDSDTTITLNDNSGLPVTFPFSLVIDYETATIEVVTAVNLTGGTTYTVERGQDGTAAQAHDAAAVVVHGVTARDVAEPQAHMEATAGVHGLEGGSSLVGTNMAQTLTNKSIDGSNNTLTNLPAGQVVGSSLTVGNVTLTDPTPDVDVAATLASHDDDIAEIQGDVTDLQVGYRYLQTVYFDSSGTFSKATYPGLRAVRSKLQAGGGGGGGAVSTTEQRQGGGGGGGGYSEKWILEAELASSETVTVGAGGTAASGAAGGAGGTTSFGAHHSASGGAGGFNGNSSNNPGGAGGVGTGGDLDIAGDDGSSGRTVDGLTTFSGDSGGSYWGGRRRAVSATNNGGFAGYLYGGGGSGGLSGAGGANQSGGVGAAGRVGVEIYV